MGGNLGLAAKGAVEGAVAGAKEVGLDVEEAASTAASSAFKAAGKIGSAAAEQVRAAVAGTAAAKKVLFEKKPSRAKTARTR